MQKSTNKNTFRKAQLLTGMYPMGIIKNQWEKYFNTLLIASLFEKITRMEVESKFNKNKFQIEFSPMEKKKTEIKEL